MQRPFVLVSALIFVAHCTTSNILSAQMSQRTILAIGAHGGDAELTMGPLLTAERARGTRVVILDLTLGERGHPTLSAEQYGAQKRSEATEIAAAIGAELEIRLYRDAEIPNDEAARRWVANVIRRVRPTLVLTHWKNSVHRDYDALGRVRGIEARKSHAVAFDIEPYGKRRVLDAVP